MLSALTLIPPSPLFVASKLARSKEKTNMYGTRASERERASERKREREKRANERESENEHIYIYIYICVRSTKRLESCRFFYVDQECTDTYNYVLYTYIYICKLFSEFKKLTIYIYIYRYIV